MKKRTGLIIFVALTIVNVIIFLRHDEFAYKPYASYEKLYGTCDEQCNATWKEFLSAYPANELAEAKHITDSLVPSILPAREKVQAIAQYLYTQFKDQSADLSPELTGSPMHQYHQLMNDRSLHLWCGNFVQLLSFFCWSQGIVTRNIEIMNPGDHHMLNECYLPELGQWVLVDVTNNISMVADGHEHLLNLQEFKKALVKGEPLIRFGGSSPLASTVPPPLQLSEPSISRYYGKDVPDFYYHTLNNAAAYSFGNKLKRYVSTSTWYDIYDSKPGHNGPFYTRLAFIILWVISAISLLAGHSKNKL